MGDRLVANVIALVLAGFWPLQISAAASCTVPNSPVVVQYDVYTELEYFFPSDSPPDPGTSADDLITTHMQAAEEVFDPLLSLSLTDGTRPDPILLRPEQADQVKELLESIGEGDIEEAIEEFKETARNDGFYNGDILNIYYVDVTPLTGMHFRKRDGYSHNIIIMGLGFLDGTLAHELGHAFSLDHANFWSHDDPDLCIYPDQPCEADNPDNRKIFPNGVQVEYCSEYAYHDNECEFSRENLMWAKSVTRTLVSENQALRAACNNTSTLIDNGDWTPPDPPIDCPDWTEEGDCEEIY